MSVEKKTFVYVEARVEIPKPKRKPRGEKGWKELAEQALSSVPVNIFYAAEEADVDTESFA